MAVSGEPRRVVILGATSGIAQAVGREYARGGAKLVLVARAADRLAAVASDLAVRGGTVALQRVADLTDLKRQRALVDEAVQALGEIDVADRPWLRCPTRPPWPEIRRRAGRPGR